MPKHLLGNVEAVFREIVHLDPLKERAVKLRLEGRVYREIVAILSGENPDRPKMNQMWVQRGCRQATKQLLRYLTIEDRQRRTKPTYTISVWYVIVETMVYVLASREHPERHTRQNQPQNKDAVAKRENIYFCPYCGKSEWKHRFQNAGGHRNLRIYQCQNCLKEVWAQSRLLNRIERTDENPPKDAPKNISEYQIE